MQLPAHKKISPDPKEWVCEESGMRENLWLNLSDGHIGSGRRQYDGSGGTNGVRGAGNPPNHAAGAPAARARERESRRSEREPSLLVTPRHRRRRWSTTR